MKYYAIISSFTLVFVLIFNVILLFSTVLAGTFFGIIAIMASRELYRQLIEDENETKEEKTNAESR